MVRRLGGPFFMTDDRFKASILLYQKRWWGGVNV
jgi:hypothetical protein